MTFAWPQKGDRLFELADRNTPILATLAGSWPTGSAGQYKEAADAVIQHVLDATNPYENSELILPICFLYRHALELRLKDLVNLGIQAHLYTRQDVEDRLNGHALAPLWTKAKQIIIHRWPDADDTPVRAVEAVINEFHQLDRTGQVFRYRIDTAGRNHNYECIEQPISGDKLRETMNAVFIFLGSCYDGIDHGLQAMRDNCR